MSENAYTPPEVSSLLGLIDTFCRWKDAKGKGSRQYYKYHPSEWGKCLRQQQYKHFVQLGYIQPPPMIQNGGQQVRLFDTGHTMHHRWQEDYFANIGTILRGVWACGNAMCHAFDDKGNLRPLEKLSEHELKLIDEGVTRHYGREEKQGVFRPEKCVCGCKKFAYKEVCVQSDELNIKGNCDIILDFSKFDPNMFEFPGIRKSFNEKMFPKRPIIVDMKTTGEWSWKSKVMKEGVHKEYIIQLLIYVHVLDAEYGVVWYENKSDSQSIAFKVERDDAKFEEIKRQAAMMKRMSERRMLPPPRPTDQDCFECSKCEFAKVCEKSGIWDDEKLDEKRKFFYGSLL
jgi:hypothetical protein